MGGGCARVDRPKSSTNLQRARGRPTHSHHNVQGKQRGCSSCQTRPSVWMTGGNIPLLAGADNPGKATWETSYRNGFLGAYKQTTPALRHTNKAETSVCQAMARCNKLWDRGNLGKRRAGGARSKARHHPPAMHLAAPTQSRSRCRQAALAPRHTENLQASNRPAQPGGSGYRPAVWRRSAWRCCCGALAIARRPRGASRGSLGPTVCCNVPWPDGPGCQPCLLGRGFLWAFRRRFQHAPTSSTNSAPTTLPT